MSGLAATLTKQVGPMPLGAWLLVGGGGLFIAYRSRQGGSAPAPAAGDPLPTAGGGYPSGGAVGSYDGAPVVLSPIFQLPKQPAPVVNVNVSTPTPTPTPTPATPPPAPTPRVPVPAKPAPTPAKQAVSYTIRKGDTLWSIAGRILGNPLRWPSIYAENKSAIEAAAKRYGYSSARGGNLIFPGTVLRITK